MLSKIMQNAQFEDLMSGGGATTLPHGTPMDHFLHVIEHGIDWSADTGQRSSYDFSRQIDFYNLVVAQPNLYERYIDYVLHAVLLIEQDQVWSGADDCMSELSEVLDKIEKAYVSQGVKMSAEPAVLAAIFDSLEFISSSENGNELDDDEQEDFDLLYSTLERATIQTALGIIDVPFKLRKI